MVPKYNWPLNTGLNCTSVLHMDFFPVVNTITLHHPQMFGSADVEFGIRWTGYNLYAEFDCAEGQRVGSPNPGAV